MATYQLRALSVGEILDTAFAVYREHFATLMVIAIVCQGVPSLLGTYVEVAGGIVMHPGLWFGAMVLSGLGGLIAAGAMVRVISEVYLGYPPSVGEALRYALSRAGRLFVAGLAKYLIIMLAALLLFVPGIIVACGYAVVAQAVVLEDLPAATDALKRSWFLTRGHRWKAFGLGVVLFLLLGLPAMVLGALVAFLPALTTTFTVGSQLVQLMLYPIFASGFTLFYYDLRVRKEAFDLDHLSRQIGLTLGPQPA
jgi:hypothetical protein